MLNRTITIEYDTPKVSQVVAELLAHIKGAGPFHWGVDKVAIIGNVLMVTDGRRLLTLDLPVTESSFADGLYFLTGEGFLLKDESGTPPKWGEVIPADEKVELIGMFVLAESNTIPDGISNVTHQICAHQYPLDFEGLYRVLRRLCRCGCQKFKVYKQKGDDERNLPIVLTSTRGKLAVKYLQIPLITE